MTRIKVSGDPRGRVAPYRLRAGARSWAVFVRCSGEENWNTNAIRFPMGRVGRKAAESAMGDLIMRWMGPVAWRIGQTTDVANRCVVAGCKNAPFVAGAELCMHCSDDIELPSAERGAGT